MIILPCNSFRFSPTPCCVTIPAIIRTEWIFDCQKSPFWNSHSQHTRALLYFPFHFVSLQTSFALLPSLLTFFLVFRFILLCPFFLKRVVLQCCCRLKLMTKKSAQETFLYTFLNALCMGGGWGVRGVFFLTLLYAFIRFPYPYHYGLQTDARWNYKLCVFVCVCVESLRRCFYSHTHCFLFSKIAACFVLLHISPPVTLLLLALHKFILSPNHTYKIVFALISDKVMGYFFFC